MNANTVALRDRTMRFVLERTLAERPEQIAVQDARHALTYKGLWSAALRLAGGFDALGLERQSCALLMLDNHVDSVVCWIALALTARAEVTINTAYKAGMLAHLIADSGSTVIVIEAHYLPRLIEIAAEVPGLKHIVLRGEAAANGDAPAPPHWRIHKLEDLKQSKSVAPAEVYPWDLMSISYTSGTTGRSKGVLCPHAHAFMQSSGRALSDTRPGETRLVVLPQFHIAGRWGGVYNAFVCGATAHIADHFSASSFWELAAQVNATTSEIVGTMAEFLWRRPRSPSERAHNMREIMIIPCPADPEAWRERFGINVVTGYGSTEIGAIVERYDAQHKGSGRVRSGFSVRVVDENDEEVPSNQVGELVVRPDLPWTSSLGYLNNPEQTSAVWRNGWLHSGDALYRDEDGNFFFVDRIDDAIRRRGENISSAEVEHYILAHPAVAEAAAVAVPSEFAEDEIKAVVVLKPGASLSESELVAFLSETVPYFMVPRFIELAAELPKTPTSKVKKKELRATGTASAWDAAAHGFAPKRERKS